MIVTLTHSPHEISFHLRLGSRKRCSLLAPCCLMSLLDLPPIHLSMQKNCKFSMNHNKTFCYCICDAMRSVLRVVFLYTHLINILKEAHSHSFLHSDKINVISLFFNYCNVSKITFQTFSGSNKSYQMMYSILSNSILWLKGRLWESYFCNKMADSFVLPSSIFC